MMIREMLMSKSGSIHEQSSWVRALFSHSRHGLLRKAILLLLYTMGLASSFVLAYELRFDFAINEDFRGQLLTFLPWIIGLKLLLLLLFGQFEGLLSYFSLPDLNRIF